MLLIELKDWPEEMVYDAEDLSLYLVVSGRRKKLVCARDRADALNFVKGGEKAILIGKADIILERGVVIK